MLEKLISGIKCTIIMLLDSSDLARQVGVYINRQYGYDVIRQNFPGSTETVLSKENRGILVYDQLINSLSLIDLGDRLLYIKRVKGTNYEPD